MKTKIVFASATALGLLMASGAYADNNVSIDRTVGNNNTASVDQTGGNSNVVKFTQGGDYNNVDVTQSGDQNYGGSHLENNGDGLDNSGDIYSGYNYVSQHGSHNDLTLKQTVGKNSIGLGASGSGRVLQSGNWNAATITQSGGVSAGNKVGVVEQKDTLASGASHTTNKLTVLQQGKVGNDGYSGVVHYANNVIGTVQQTNPGGAFNELTLTQKGGGALLSGATLGNEIWQAVQSGSDNDGTVTQDGKLNFLALLSQVGTSNDATIILRGNSNGLKGVGHVGTAFSLSAASGAGVTQATATQNGDRNALSYSATGDNNLFGFVQSGTVSGNDNDITGTTVDNNNQAAVGQWGNNNNTTFSQSGDANDLGVAIHGDNNGRGGFSGAAIDVGLTNGDVRQSGGGNSASITIGDITNASSNNDYAAKQTGGGNTLTLSLKYGSSGNGNNSVAVSQAGDDTATITVTGGSNVLGARQLGSGTNSLTVSIDGSSNNSSTTMTGDAGDLGLKAGSIYQNNTGSLNNDVSLTIQTSFNKFAVKQVGSDNQVTGTVTTGNGNQAAVIQVGMSNTASFLQNGGGNNIGITQ